MKYICSLITVNDMMRSRDFYERILDQKVKADYGENVTYHGDFAIHLKSHFRGLIDDREIKSTSNNFELFFEYDDIEAIVEKITAYGVTFVHPAREQPWRQKVVRFYDPDGNMIEIGESMEHLSYRLFNEGLKETEISEITYMPVEFVIEAIQKHKQ